VRRQPTLLGTTEYDVLVVGGGIFGVCAAWEAASRGLRVALVERGDFGHATSANSYKIVHGGMRYLQHADLPRVWESCRERSALLRVAPHLVRPMPILVPTYGWGMRGKPILRAGFAVYDALTTGRNRGIRDPGRRIPRARFLSRQEILRHYPDLPQEGLTGAALFYDAQMYNPPRLTLAFLQAAVEAGAHAVNYAEVQEFLRSGNRIRGVVLRDFLEGGRIEVRARVVLNAAGPWAARLAEQLLDLDFGGERPTFSRDVGLVTRKQLPSSLGLACPTATRDAESVLDRGARHLFLLPWRDFTLVGVWHGVYAGSPDDLTVTDDELQSFVDDANHAYAGLALTADDVVMVNTGLILFGRADQGGDEHSFGKRSLLVDHGPRGLEGLITLVGVRATTARAAAEKAVDLTFTKLGQQRPPSVTEHTPIWGGYVTSVTGLAAALTALHPWLVAPVAAALAQNHGSRVDEVLALAEADPRLRQPLGDSSVLAAEVVHAVRREMACTLADVVLRRTDLGTAQDPGRAALEMCATLVAHEKGWDKQRRLRELADLRHFFAARGARRLFGRSARTAAASGGRV
jgi:glycerol-3-phosphate dehydrogenase